eukprot:1861451-Rhodomonas_salina.2
MMLPTMMMITTLRIDDETDDDACIWGEQGFSVGRTLRNRRGFRRRDEVESLDESDAIRSRECFASDDGRVTIDEDMSDSERASERARERERDAHAHTRAHTHTDEQIERETDREKGSVQPSDATRAARQGTRGARAGTTLCAERRSLTG